MEPGTDSVSVGGVFGRALDAVWRDAAVWPVLALLVGVPSFTTEYLRLDISLLRSLGDNRTVVILAALLIWVAAAALFQAIGLRLAIDRLSGRPRDLGGAIGAGFAMLPAFIAVQLLYWLICGAGSLLIAPGPIFYVMFVLAAPVLVEERRGIYDSLIRSQDLTSGLRWKVAAVLGCYWGAVLLIGIFFAFRDARPATEAARLTEAMILGAYDMVSYIFHAALLAALFVAVRTAKEGPAAAGVAEVFA